ncbi:GrpB family protein [Macrococcus hajekii]|uniref:GrpB family protein n=1 Tax=Macrococcus hajekii TaxID=198482 RepID=A0A4R6BHZ5_9STAP|nr:GrpB family protein [Macrococcus hajekii]TDM01134.1 GrpB family protein [Macrococcus hajekii]GGB12191.1 hypothetical protein GCM10007190_20310 [Macrococcus hajekii]
MRSVKVVAYDSIWQHLYLDEMNKLKEIFKGQMIEIFHIGSTAVPGLVSKPIIDMMLVVKDISQVDLLNEPLIRLGYEPKGENGIKGRRYFQKGQDNRSHHLHIYQTGDENIKRHLAFRDYLRTFSGEAERYGHLKAELAKLYLFDIDSYIAGKNIFVQVMEIKALDWYDVQLEKKEQLILKFP